MAALFQRADYMFPEGHGRVRAVPKVGAPASFINALVVNTKTAIDKLWEQRGYDKLKPDDIKARLGYRLDREEAKGYVLTGALHLPVLSPREACFIGRRVDNALGKKAALGKQLAVHKKRGTSDAALLQAEATISLEPPPPETKVAAAAPAPPPAPPAPPAPAQPPPPPPPLPPPTVPFDHAEKLIEYDHPVGRWVGDKIKFSFDIPGYRGVPGDEGGGGRDDPRYWDPEKPPCVSSDFRPEHLIKSPLAAKAAIAANEVEFRCKPPDFDDENDERHYDEERDEIARVKYKHALRRLFESFPELDPCPMLAHASQHCTRPCPCGRGVLARWPWVVQDEERGFCACSMGGWELICWRGEWEEAARKAIPRWAW